MQNIGACIEFYDDKITVKKSYIGCIEIDCKDIPDLVPVLVGMAAYANGTTVLKNIARLKNKESSRVNEICTSLSAVGIGYDFNGDDLTVYGGRPYGAKFACVKDHRIVMLNVLLAAGAEGKSVICGAECVSKSYPEFFEALIKIGGKIDVRI